MGMPIFEDGIVYQTSKGRIDLLETLKEAIEIAEIIPPGLNETDRNKLAEKIFCERHLNLYMTFDETFELVTNGFKSIRKWDYETHSYHGYGVPKEWKIATYCADMSQHINCAGCGKLLPYGETFTSLELHTSMGFGYGVCNECYDKEWERRRRSESQ